MPQAPDLNTLLDFEGEIEKGITAQFDAEGLPSINKQQDGDDAVFPRYGFRFSSGGVFNNHSAICPDGVERYDTYKGSLTVEIYTFRSEETGLAAGETKRHKTYRSGARRAMLGFRKRFGPDVMPYFEIGEVKESGSSPAMQSGDDIDTTTLSYDVVFQIRPDAWPNDLT